MLQKIFGLGEFRSGKDLFAFNELLSFWDLKFEPYYPNKYTFMKNLKGKGGLVVICDKEYNLIKVQYSKDDIYSYIMMFLSRNKKFNRQMFYCSYVDTTSMNPISVKKSICKTYHYRPISKILFELEKTEFTNFSIFLNESLWTNACDNDLISYRYRAGIYIFREKNTKEIVYVGKSHNSVYYRMKIHFYELSNKPTHIYYPDSKMIEVCIVEVPRANLIEGNYIQNNPIEIKNKCQLIESCLIKKFQPRDNKYLLGDQKENIPEINTEDFWGDSNHNDEAPF